MNRQSALVTILSLALVSFLLSSPLHADPNDNTARKAFDLRLAGQAEEAKALLEKAIAAAPGNGELHYELSRTLLCLGLGEAKKSVDDVQDALALALKCDPNNERYTSFAGYIAFFDAYISMHQNSPRAKEQVREVCRKFELLMQLNPKRCEPCLYLAEIYSCLPEDLGGDKAKAEACAKKLEAMDPIFGAKARAMLLPDDADAIDFWKGILKQHEGNAEVLEELGRNCLYEDKIEEGVKYLEAAVEADPSKTVLLLDIGRYHLMRVMRDMGDKEKALPAAEAAIRKYLATKPVIPMQAYAYEMLAKVEFGWGDQEGSEKLRKQAEELDPNYSKAFGVPHLALFVPPEETYHAHRYLFRPF